MKIHNHPIMERNLGVDDNHVIIDRDLFNVMYQEDIDNREEDNLDEDGYCKYCQLSNCTGGWSCPGAY